MLVYSMMKVASLADAQSERKVIKLDDAQNERLTREHGRKE